jgi:glycerate 2-kinase
MPPSLHVKARQILDAALTAAHAGNMLAERLQLQGDVLHYLDQRINLKQYQRIFVIGAGKASATMAREMESLLGDRLTAGAVVSRNPNAVDLKKIKAYPGDHPIVNENSLKASEKILDLTNDLNADDLVFVLISGGGSALLEKFAGGIDLEDASEFSRLLFSSGMQIHQINTIRKRISALKGGGLARHLAPARVISFILSDVVSDRIDMVASGPTVPGMSRFDDVVKLLKMNKLWAKTPAQVVSYLSRGQRQEKKTNDILGDARDFPHVTNILLGGNRDALLAAAKQARDLGYTPLILTSMAQGEARDIAAFFAGIVSDTARFGQPVQALACLIFGGETTVTVTGEGIGGRNLEFCLSAAIHIRHFNQNVLIAAMGTDGNDGIADAAGAMITQYTFDKGMSIGINAYDYLHNNDSYSFFEQVGGLLHTGPTGTNVMDIGIAIIQ